MLTPKNDSLLVYQEGKNEEALTCFQKARKINAEESQYWANEGVLLRRLKCYAEAHDALDKALDIDPKDAYAHNIKGLVFADEERNEEALTCFQKAQKINPGEPRYWIHEGDTLCQLKRYAEAHVALDKALDTDPENADAHNIKGLVFAEEGRNEEALACFKKAQKIKPGKSRYRMNEAHILLKLEARHQLDDVQKLDADSSRSQNKGTLKNLCFLSLWNNKVDQLPKPIPDEIKEDYYSYQHAQMKEIEIAHCSQFHDSSIFSNRRSLSSIDIFANAKVTVDVNNKMVFVIYNNLERAKECRGKLRDEYEIVDRGNTSQPKKIDMPDDDSFIIKLTATEYDTVKGKGKFAELTNMQVPTEKASSIQL